MIAGPLCGRGMHGRRGYYTVITTFFFIVVVIAVVLLALNIQGKVFSLQRYSDDQTLGYTVAREARAAALLCYGADLPVAKLDAGGCALPALVEGMQVVQLGHPPCAERRWSFGNETGQAFVTFAPVLHDNGTKCMGRVIIYPRQQPRG